MQRIWRQNRKLFGNDILQRFFDNILDTNFENIVSLFDDKQNGECKLVVLICLLSPKGTWVPPQLLRAIVRLVPHVHLPGVSPIMLFKLVAFSQRNLIDVTIYNGLTNYKMNMFGETDLSVIQHYKNFATWMIENKNYKRQPETYSVSNVAVGVRGGGSCLV